MKYTVSRRGQRLGTVEQYGEGEARWTMPFLVGSADAGPGATQFDRVALWLRNLGYELHPDLDAACAACGHPRRRHLDAGGDQQRCSAPDQHCSCSAFAEPATR